MNACRRIAVAILTAALSVACGAAWGACPGSGACRPITKLGPKCCCRRQVVDRQDPRPELNPPDDVSTLPEREQRKFVKIFNLVPEQVKVKSTQNYEQRMVFARSKQYATITDKLKQRLGRSAKQLAAEPAVTASEVVSACDETITYGRMLAMGNMVNIRLEDIAERYGFKNAAKAVERINDAKNLRRGIAAGWPEKDAECAAFAKLAGTANPAQWKAFLERAERLRVIAAENAATPARRPTNRAQLKKEIYDDYDVAFRSEVPDDLVSLSKRDRVRLTKALEFLPARVKGCAGQDYAVRKAFFDSSEYRAVRQELTNRLVREAQRLAGDPAVRAPEILALCDEVVRFGRPLAMGDMRDVSWQELARRYRFPGVSEFIRRAEEDRNAKIGFREAYPEKDPEFRDFEILAKKANAARWEDFRTRIAGYNQIFRQKKSRR